ncbi:hypothetical protein COCON_G00087100 [Conger conger]|uniref:Repulsive guidance molecule A n=1 Tax=Conger conger TaxID=82655 RepID=A0A9Q1I0J5_CONCO|nr:hypothetical protein COCON_G00087100 [Conger conger]
MQWAGQGCAQRSAWSAASSAVTRSSWPPRRPRGGPQYCAALRGFSVCTRRTARGCRGDLVYHSAVFRIKELLAQHNCSSEGPTAAPRGPSAPPRPCDYESGAPGPVRYVHCGLFGDPHLRTFGGELQTCRAEGAWPLLDNRYLSVQVTNVPVAPGSAATATSQVTLIFKASAGCSEARVYQASAEDLPAVVRRAGRYLGLAVRMPEAALGSSQDEGGLQLCLHGCPLSERVETPPPAPAPPHSPARTAEWASARCREALQVEDGYLRACVFDLLTTGDAQFTQAAQGALEDLQALPPTRLEHASPGAPHLHDTGGARPPLPAQPPHPAAAAAADATLSDATERLSISAVPLRVLQLGVTMLFVMLKHSMVSPEH